MRMQDFIRDNRAEIDAVIRRNDPNADTSDSERELWIANDEGLYNWAISEGVDV